MGSLDALDERVIQVPGVWTEWNSMRFNYANQKTQFKTYGLFVFGNFDLILSECGWLQVTEIMESETEENGGTTVLIAAYGILHLELLETPLEVGSFPKPTSMS